MATQEEEERDRAVERILVSTHSDVHEDWPGNPAADKTMDLHNNQVGISTANRTSDCFDDVNTARDRLVWIYND